MFIIFRKARNRRKKRKKPDNSWKIHKKQAHELVENLIKSVEHPYDFCFNRICIRNQRTRWGSCSSKRNLNFNYRVIHLPYELAKYIVVHELCHLKHMNHSKEFWNLVATIIPAHKEFRKKLRKVDMKTLK